MNRAEIPYTYFGASAALISPNPAVTATIKPPISVVPDLRNISAAFAIAVTIVRMPKIVVLVIRPKE